MNHVKTLFKSALIQYGPQAALILGLVTAPIVWGFVTYTPAPDPSLEQLRELITRQLKAAPVLPAPVLPAQVTIQQRTPAPTVASAPLSPLAPIPDPVMAALYAKDRELEALRLQFTQLEHLVRSGQYQAARPTGQSPAGVDENGNTEAAKNDLYSDVNPPVFPDPMIKALARNPGARLIADPETGQYVPAVVEYRESNVGGGKQLHLLRKDGRLYGQTIIHRGAAPAPEPKPEPFRLNLGNN